MTVILENEAEQHRRNVIAEVFKFKECYFEVILTDNSYFTTMNRLNINKTNNLKNKK